MYLTCPCCHLRVFRRPDEFTDERCPRCGERTTVSFRRDRILRAAPALGAFEHDVVRQGTTTTLRVSGEVDVADQDRLRAAGVAAARGCECLVVDLTTTTFLSSSGVRALVEIREAVEACGGRMVALVEEDGAAARVIELCALGEHLGVAHEPDRTAAAPSGT